MTSNVREQLNEFESSLISMQEDRMAHEIKMDQLRVFADSKKREEMWTKINNIFIKLNISLPPLPVSSSYSTVLKNKTLIVK